MKIQNRLFATLRIFLSLTFLWAFFDKLFGLGFATTAEKAWINGGSPTYGFLSNATQGPFADIFRSLAGVALVDWLFMLGLLGIGLSLLFKRFLRIGVSAGVILMALMYLAVIPPENNPLIDDHIIYIVSLLLIGSHYSKVE